MLKRIGAEEGGEFKAVASGTLPCGKPVVVNADGTVSVVSETTAAGGTPVAFDSGTIRYTSVAYDSANEKIVIVYEDSSNSEYGTAIVGTVNPSDNSISFGTAVVFESADMDNTAIAYDANAGKVVIAYRDKGNSNQGTAIVGTVSGTSISFGTSAVFENGNTDYVDIVYESNAQKVVISYQDQSDSANGKSIVGTVSGTSISFGSAQQFGNAFTYSVASTFDSTNNKVVVLWRDVNDSSKGKAKVGTVSGTSISFAGSEVTFESGAADEISTDFDTSSGKVIVAFHDPDNSNKGTAIVGTVSGNDISFGDAVIFNDASTTFTTTTYNPAANKTFIAFKDAGNSNYLTAIVGTVSGTSISFGSETVLDQVNGLELGSAYDSSQDRIVVSYRNSTDSEGSSVVFRTGSANLTSENYIGMSRGVVNATSLTQTIGSAVTFEDADTKYTVATFDSVNNKVIIAYRDNGNGGYLTAIVGTVSGTSISFGTPVVAASNSSQYLGIAFNANAGKCVISYRNASTQKGLAIVGTVSGTSISFGTAAIFNNADTEYTVAAYDAASQNVVIAYKDQGNSSYGTAIVAVISGTSVSFGSEVVFQSTNSNPRSIVYDSGSSKVIIGYRKYDSWMRGFGVVGTVSGNSISFGTPVRFDTHNTSGYDIEYISLTYDSNANKTLFAYRGNSQNGQINVATVSGTSISFGTVVTFHAANTQEILSFYDPDAQLHGIAYEDVANTPDFEYVTATISGTSATISSPTAISSNIGSSQMTMGATYDTNANKGVLAYQILSPDSRGTARVIQNASTTITRAEVANSGNASIDIIGSVSDNQVNLTAGQQYFVQTDGTISTTAGSPSVLAGTAISATELVVKT